MNIRTKALACAGLVALLALQGPAEAAQDVSINLDAADICNQASWFPLAVHPRIEPAGCVSPLDSGGLVWLNLPGELLEKSHVRMDFLVPSAPLPGVTPFGLLKLNHVIVALIFEQQGISVALIADNGEFLPPPSFMEGEILGEIAYGVPFEVEVHANLDRHGLTVRQGAETIASGSREKAKPHADPLMFESYFSAPGSIRDLDWFFGSAEFKGKLSPVGIAGILPSGPALGALGAERIGDVIRVTNRF